MGSDLRWFFAVFSVFPQFGPFLDAKHEQVEVRRAPPRSPRSLRIWGSTRSSKNPPKKYGNCANPVVFPQSRAASSWAPSRTCSGSASGRSSRARGGGDRNSSFPRGVFAPKRHFSPRTGSNLSFFSPPIPFFPLFPPSAGSQLVLVPSLRDVSHDFVYPQPPFPFPDLPKEDRAVPTPEFHFSPQK